MSFFSELKQRKVFRVATGYVVAAWIAIQGASIALPAFDAPPWVMRVFILMFVLGFPLALTLSWAVDVTSEGVKVGPRSKSDKAMGLLVLVLMTCVLGWYFFRPISITRPAAPTLPAAAVSPPAPTTAPPSAAKVATAPAQATPIPPIPSPPSEPSATRAAPVIEHPKAAQPETVIPPRELADDAHGARPRPNARSGPDPTAEASLRCREVIRRIREAIRERADAGIRGPRKARAEAFNELRRTGCLEEARRSAPEALQERR